MSLRVNQFYKTKVCPWYCKGTCERGDACRFAHNDHEQRKLPDLSRTRLCPLVLTYGTCDDAKCKFAHEPAELRATDDMYKTSLCFLFMKNRCKAGNQCRHAHGRHELHAKRSTACTTFTSNNNNAVDPKAAVIKASLSSPNNVAPTLSSKVLRGSGKKHTLGPQQLGATDAARPYAMRAERETTKTHPDDDVAALNDTATFFPGTPSSDLLQQREDPSQRSLLLSSPSPVDLPPSSGAAAATLSFSLGKRRHTSYSPSSITSAAEADPILLVADDRHRQSQAFSSSSDSETHMSVSRAQTCSTLQSFETSQGQAAPAEAPMINAPPPPVHDPRPRVFDLDNTKEILPGDLDIPVEHALALLQCISDIQEEQEQEELPQIYAPASLGKLGSDILKSKTAHAAGSYSSGCGSLITSDTPPALRAEQQHSYNCDSSEDMTHRRHSVLPIMWDPASSSFSKAFDDGNSLGGHGGGAENGSSLGGEPETVFEFRRSCRSDLIVGEDQQQIALGLGGISATSPPISNFAEQYIQSLSRQLDYVGGGGGGGGGGSEHHQHPDPSLNEHRMSGKDKPPQSLSPGKDYSLPTIPSLSEAYMGMAPAHGEKPLQGPDDSADVVDTPKGLLSSSFLHAPWPLSQEETADSLFSRWATTARPSSPTPEPIPPDHSSLSSSNRGLTEDRFSAAHSKLKRDGGGGGGAFENQYSSNSSETTATTGPPPLSCSFSSSKPSGGAAGAAAAAPPNYPFLYPSSSPSPFLSNKSCGGRPCPGSAAAHHPAPRGLNVWECTLLYDQMFPTYEDDGLMLRPRRVSDTYLSVTQRLYSAGALDATPVTSPLWQQP